MADWENTPPPSAGPVPGGEVPRETVIKIIVGAVVIFIAGILLMNTMGGDDAGPDDESADIELAPVEEFVPFAPPEIPDEDGLPEEPPEVDPDEWDPVVRDLIPYIEEERNLRFKEPVEIQLLNTAELLAVFGTTTNDPFIEQYLLDLVGSYRAVGIYEGGFDVGAYLSRADEVGVTGLYDPTLDTVYVNTDVGSNGGEPGTSPFQQAVLLHELVHALQDQHADLGESVATREITMRRMMVEGDARRVERLWAATLPDDQYDQYWSTMSNLIDPEGLDGVLGIEGDFVYEGGLEVTSLVQDLDSSAALDTLLQYPPDRPGQLLRVSSLFLHGGQPWDADAEAAEYPPFPVDSYPIAEGSQGAWLWYVTMATRIDPSEALRAADAIANDRFRVYEQDGKICGAYQLAAVGAGDAGHLAIGIRDWATSLPHGADVSIDGQVVSVTACDPGEGAAMNFVRSPEDIVDGPIARVRAVSAVLAPQRGWWADEELKERERWCLAETVQRAVPVDEALEGLSDERIEELGEAAVRSCLPDRVPGGPKPVEGECSAAGMDPDLDGEGLPDEVATTRREILEAAVACDYGALATLFADNGPFVGDGGLPAPERAGAMTDRWERLEGREERPLADLVHALSAGWMCGPDVVEVIEDREGDACAFLSGGRGPVDDEALVVLIGSKGGWLGFGSNGSLQDAVLGMWAETITGDRDADDYETGGGPGVGGLPRGWPIAVSPSVLLAEG